MKHKKQKNIAEEKYLINGQSHILQVIVSQPGPSVNPGICEPS
jgi:hypothetical protein